MKRKEAIGRKVRHRVQMMVKRRMTRGMIVGRANRIGMISLILNATERMLDIIFAMALILPETVPKRRS